MSGEEICGAETSTAKVQEQSLANREGDEFIRVLSAIASAADRNYTPVADTGTAAEDPITIVTEAQDDQYDESVAKLLTAIAVSSGNTSTSNSGTVIQLVVPPSEPTHVAMVQKEVLVGSPELSLADCGTISEQPLPVVVNIEEIETYETTNTAPLYKEPTAEKRLIFLTNFRDYTISLEGGNIWVGERKEPGKIIPPMNIVPATDNATGFKFSYQYRRGSTVKRFEDKEQVIFFIGQISNERILVLFLQTVYQLIHKMGNIDLDREYSSGRIIKSKFYRGMIPSKARTIRTPIEKLTYIKMLIVGDATQEEIDAEKEASNSDENSPIKNKCDSPEADAIEEIPAPVTESTEKQMESEKEQIKENTESVAPSKDKKIESVAPSKEQDSEKTKLDKEKHVSNEMEMPGKTNQTQNEVVKSTEVSISKEKTAGSTTKGKRPQGGNKKQSVAPDRGSSKRKIRPPSKFVDFCDLPGGKKVKVELGSDEENPPAEGEGKTKPSKKEKLLETTGTPQKTDKEQTAKHKGKLTPRKDVPRKGKASPKKAASVEKLTDTADGSTTSVPHLPSIEDDVQIILGSMSPEKEKQTNTSKPKETKAKATAPSKKQNKNKTKANEVVSEIPKKKRGRPKKEDKEMEDDDEKAKYRYPSLDFQRALNLSKYLCQVCLTNHKKDAVKESEVCPIVKPSEHNLDQDISGSETRALLSLPSSLSVKLSKETRKLTVCAGQDLPTYTQFGPLVGILLSEEDIQTDTDLSHIWFLQQEDDGEKYFLYTGDETATNWCHYLHTVPSATDYNVVMVLKDDGIFFTTSNEIKAGTQLKVLIPYFGNRCRPIAEVDQMECLHCKRSFLSPLDYQKHYHIFHPGGFTKQKQKCRMCKRSFPSMKDMQKHMNEDHGGMGAFQCHQCPRSFHNPARLRVHQNDVHPPPEAAVPCEKCGKIYRSKRALANHMTNVHSLFKFACQICEKWFDRRSTLLRHMRSHSSLSGILCTRCGKRFRDRHNLKVHMLSHSGVKPFQCHFCVCTSFSTRTCLKLHYERTHFLNEDQMPPLERSVPFTMEAYSAGEVCDIEPDKTKKKNSSEVNSSNVNYIISPKNRKSKSSAGSKKMPHMKSVLKPGKGPGSATEVTLHIGEDHHMEVEEVVQEVGTTEIMSVVDEEKTSLPAYFTEMVQTDSPAGTDHCYYALNVDGQQVLVPATGEEVCVILEDDNTITVPTS